MMSMYWDDQLCRLARLSGCASGHKEDTLIYAARYSALGQAAFLRSAIPANLLRGFKVRFFGPGLTYSIRAELEAAAKQRTLTLR